MSQLARVTVKLRSGAAMPIFGLGTWAMAEKDECTNACAAALAAGYRLLDTATMYENEAEVGAALAESEVARDEVFVVSKLKGGDHGAEAPRDALDLSLAKLRLDHLDLWLMHSPAGADVVATWRAMLALRDAGKCRAVGVSNFGVAQLKQLAACGLEAPEVNQIELHPWLQQRPTVEYCRANGIVTMGYAMRCPFRRTRSPHQRPIGVAPARSPGVRTVHAASLGRYCPLARTKQFGATALAALAAEAGRSEAELALRWCVQSGHVTIPKSKSAERIVANAACLEWELTGEQVPRLCRDTYAARCRAEACPGRF